MNVVIISAYPPESAPEANHALHISENLAKVGVTVEIICKTGSIESTHPNITVHPVMENWKWRSMPRLARQISECRPDVVLLLYLGWVYDHEPMITFLPTLCKAVVPGVPCITQFENVDEYIPWRSLLTGVARKMASVLAGRKGVHRRLGTLLSNSNKIIALSSPHRDRLACQDSSVSERTVILPPPPLIRLAQGDPVETRRHIRREIGVRDGDFVLMYWGYIYPGKGIETLLHAFQKVCDEVENARLVLVGGCLEVPMKATSSGDYYEMVRNLPKKLGIAERVTWTGQFDWDSDIGSQYLHAGDACILPLDHGVTLNNSSLAAAATHGLPIIGTEIPGLTDEALEHGHNIYLCPPKDAQALAESMQQMIENRDFRERLRTGSRNLARKWYASERNTQHLVQVLQSTIAEAECRIEDRSTTSAPISKSLARVSSGTSGASVQSPSTDAQSQSISLATSQPSASVKTKSDGDAPLISVIVAAYNVSKYISQCLDSLANQTLTNIEIIVVNDGSTDKTLNIINEYVHRYDNIKVLTFAANVGTASARNAGLRAATGEFIAFVDSDDWVSIRMCEVMYRRATDVDADVLVTDAAVYYQDMQVFTPFFDHSVRKNLDTLCTSTSFDIYSAPRVLLLEPVLWTKLCKRTFLEDHRIHFQDGMNSYEDLCFHFSVLIKAKTIRLIDDRLVHYRQNRPGQISGRINRKVFEVFSVFRTIHEQFLCSHLSADIWAQIAKVEIRQFDWLINERLQPEYKSEFFVCVAHLLAEIPKTAFITLSREARPEERVKIFCMRRNWLWGYEKVLSRHWFWFPLLCLLLQNDRREVIARGFRRLFGSVAWKCKSGFQSAVHKFVNLTGFERKLQVINESLSQLRQVSETSVRNGKHEVFPVSIGKLELFISHWADESAFRDSVWRAENDYYLFKTAIFREGDVVVDVGAHLGISAIYLAKQYPFVTVYALEPEPNNFSCLKENIELNNVSNVVPINKALSGDGKKTTLFTDPLKSNWATINTKTAARLHRLHNTRVETMTLSKLFRDFDIAHCRMLKVSAHGAVRESLEAFTDRERIDFLCGEVDLTDSSKAWLEVASWSIARQHFWRILGSQTRGTNWSWIHQMPLGLERAPRTLISSVTAEHH